MSTAGLVSVIIINFNSRNYIFDCLKSLECQTYRTIEILIIDNSSTDGSSEILKSYETNIPYKYYRLENNMGSSYANNYGINNAKGEYLLILNADVFLDRDFIEKSIIAFEYKNNVGTVVGKLVSNKNNSIIDSVGVKIYAEGFGRDIGYGENDSGQYDKACIVDGACCAAAIYKREMLEDLGYGDEYFDEDFFAFYEDLDLSYRSNSMGWKTLYTPEARGQHVRGGSTQSVSEFVKYLSSRNILFFLIKTYRPETIKAKFCWILYLLIKLFYINKKRFFYDYYKLRNNFKNKKKFLENKHKVKLNYFDSYIWERAKKIVSISTN